jgi:hypothetical protein
MAAVLGFMGCDELAGIHEFLENRSGYDWQALYLPIVAVAVVAWSLILRELRHERALAVYWVAGAAAWAGTQVLEHLEYDADDHHAGAYGAKVVVEEVLEMTGTALFGLAMLVAVGLAASRWQEDESGTG